MLTSHAVHVCTVRHNLALHLLVLGIFDESLVFTCTALAETAESEDKQGKANHAADNTDDNVLGGLRKTVPLLSHGFRG